MIAAAYARVSTSDGRQSLENQLASIRQFCTARGWTLARTFMDQASGGDRGRDGLADLMAHAHRGEFAIVVVWALDRLTRDGVLDCFERIQRLREYGVQFVSVTEPHFATTGGAGELFLAVAAWMAQQERSRIRQRVKAGVDRARAAGKQLGRPRVVLDHREIQKRVEAGRSIRSIARELGYSAATVARAWERSPLRVPAAP